MKKKPNRESKRTDKPLKPVTNLSQPKNKDRKRQALLFWKEVENNYLRLDEEAAFDVLEGMLDNFENKSSLGLEPYVSPLLLEQTLMTRFQVHGQ